MRFAIILLVSLLAACGGGDPEDNPLTCEATSAVSIATTGGVLGHAGAAIKAGDGC